MICLFFLSASVYVISTWVGLMIADSTDSVLPLIELSLVNYTHFSSHHIHIIFSIFVSWFIYHLYSSNSKSCFFFPSFLYA